MNGEERKIVEALDEHLSMYHSATKALESLFENRPIEVERICSRIVVPPPIVSKVLGLANGEFLHYRHVILKAQNVEISQTQNWFIAQYLTKDMLEALEQTSKPFGSVVEALGFKRQRLDVNLGTFEEENNNTILQHRAVLTLRDETPFCFVEENYLQGLLNYLLRKSGDNGLRRRITMAYL